MRIRSGLLVIASIIAAQAASASIIQADFSESLDLPSYGSSGPRVLTRTNVGLPDGGFVLDNTDEVSNPSLWTGMLQLSFDSATNILSVTGDGENSYQSVTIDLANLIFSDGATVTGITELATGNAVIPFIGATPTLSTSFTANSASITYQVSDLDLFLLEPGTDEFQLTLGPATSSAPAPEPGTILLGGLTLTGLGLARRRFAR
jgi:hypothetical protein